MSQRKIFIHVVTYNSAAHITSCLASLTRLHDYALKDNLRVDVTDNASSDKTLELIANFVEKGVRVYRNESNLGFCGAHNQGLKRFLDGGYDFYLCLNPDVALEADSLIRLVEGIETSEKIGSACPKLLRADYNLRPITPPTLDAAGMFMTPSLRHFDRGSGQVDSDLFRRRCFVFGGSGACLLMRRSFILDLAVDAANREADVDAIYPQLAHGRENRYMLFDEAFFAYREDADLAWRSLLLGWRCIFVPEAVGYHVRLVTPERRQQLPPTINLLGVKNRFLLQLNNYSLALGLSAFVFGYVLRNIAVVIACLLRERSSLRAFPQIFKVFARALVRRKIVAKRAKCLRRDLAKWFSFTPYCENI